MGKMSRDKGARGEREAIAVLADELGAKIGKQLSRNLQQTRDGGTGGDILSLGVWRIEVKRAQAPLYSVWWRQAVDQAGDGVPVIMSRLDRQRWQLRVHISDVLPDEFGDWPRDDFSGVMMMTVQAFCSLVRSTLPFVLPVDVAATAAREVC